jgi:hypothetical protein
VNNLDVFDIVGAVDVGRGERVCISDEEAAIFEIVVWKVVFT